MELAPEMAVYVQKILSLGLKGFSEGTPVERRTGYSAIRSLLGEGPEMSDISDTSILTSNGKIVVRNYIPKKEIRSRILYFHGGGWAVGNLNDFDPFARTLANGTSSIVSLVDYRLAPEFPFPAAIDDATCALEWITTRKDWEKFPLVVAGDSAGGNLASVIVREARDKKRPKIDLQVLIYPVTDANFETASYKTFEHGPGLTRKDMEWFWNQYIPDESKRNDPRASPLRAESLRDLPPTIIFTAGLDPLRDDGELYADRLAEEGVPTYFKRFEGYTHGFFTKVNILSAPEEGIREISNVIEGIIQDEANERFLLNRKMYPGIGEKLWSGFN
ncbi:putative 4-hydroxyacetophenone monooxygenase [Leptospira fainei serovar Hurstbridge str. BUT 6]|uniref:4-hydroxyacetophenone monooxygenase n=1 Tax=Leptospira fainei serovar Hurstbridge str. BUT 6 TaxID=1193011 RepID=S3V2J9_9LEPT|nr:alpha/beta hydrolase [Leptospira fainei]EPG74864.1 putative 4-hydroxyacetophenone monooxygenase [Leptospira fainei serovar Hurstbridge str. BUT 6]